MQKQQKDILRNLVTALRHRLAGAWDETGTPVRGDLDRELERLGFSPDGRITSLDALVKPVEGEVRAYRVAEAQLTALPEGQARRQARAEIVERAGYTWINRLLALRSMEVRGFIDETLRPTDAYDGIPEALYILRHTEPARTQGPDGGWWVVLDDACRAHAHVLPGLFDPDDPNVALRPSTPALLDCIRYLGGRLPNTSYAVDDVDAVFRDPDTIGWAYQFYQQEAKDRVYTKLGRGGKVETRSEIAAATQLFTETYMVKWMLQNSLGRSYHETYPNSKLPARWEYYIDRDRLTGDTVTGDMQDASSRATFQLADLTLLDPCPGSGHILREGFDMLFDMYQEQHPEMEAHEIASRILSRHLFGVDIDPRAVQLAALTLVLRAWELIRQHNAQFNIHDLRFNFSLNLATTPTLAPGALDRHLAHHPEDAVYRPVLAGVFAALEQAPMLGSLLRPEEHLDAAIAAFRNGGKSGQMRLLGESATANRLLEELDKHDPSELKRLLLERIGRSFAREAKESDVSAQLLGREASEGVHLLQILGRRYSVVCTNPPYMGSKNMDAVVKAYVEQHYKAGKRDLYAAFILRCLELCRHAGRVAMITQQSWMFLKSFADLRAVPDDALAKAKQKGEFTGLLRETSIEGLAHLGEHAFEEQAAAGAFAAMFTLGKRAPDTGHRLLAIRLTAIPSSSEKHLALTKGMISGELVRSVNQMLLLRIHGAPVVYALDPTLILLIAEGRKLQSLTSLRQGVATTEDPRFLRCNWETPKGRPRWLPFEKGEGYSRWVSASTYEIDWEADGARIKTRIDTRPDQFVWTMRMPKSEAFFQRGLTFSVVGRGALGVRFLEDSIFGAKSPFIFTETIDRGNLAGYLNSHVASYMLRSLAQGIELGEGYVRLIPYTRPISEDITLSKLAIWCRFAKEQCLSSSLQDTGFSIGDVHHGNTKEVYSALLLHAEGLAELAVLKSLQVGSEIVSELVLETGTPSGWYPLVAGYDRLPDFPDKSYRSSLPQEMLNTLTSHERLIPTPVELVRIKANLKSVYEVGPGVKDDQLDLEELDFHNNEEETAAGTYISIPIETFLEELSVKLRIHPISVYWLLEELRAEGVRCKPEEKRLLEDHLTVLVLRLLGHLWPKQIEAGEPVPTWADQDGVIPLIANTGEVTLADRVRTRLRIEEGDLGAQRTEALLQELTGRTLAEWLRRDFFKRHVSQFKRRPIAWHLLSDPTAGGRKRSAEPAFECMIYYHRTDTDILARIRRQYVEPLLKPERQVVAQARQGALPRAAADETAVAVAAGRIRELEDFAQRLRSVEEHGFACPELEAFVAQELLDRWCGDGVFAPGSRDTLLAQERAWTVDINDGVRVNVAPLQVVGLLANEVLNAKDLGKAIGDRARWRSDERRWVRQGKLPRCGWMPEDVPESPKWTELAPEREKERLRLEEKRRKVLAELAVEKASTP